jgi:hypothetical protein
MYLKLIKKSKITNNNIKKQNQVILKNKNYQIIIIQKLKIKQFFMNNIKNFDTINKFIP